MNLIEQARWAGDQRRINGSDSAVGKAADCANLKPVDEFSFARLRRQYPAMRPALIDGILRECETANLISGTKDGKTWLTHGLIFDFIMQRNWLNRFSTSGGSVLLIDFELHRETLSSRLQTVADAKGTTTEEIADRLIVWPMRGTRRRLFDLRRDLERSVGKFKLVCIDAKYRATGNTNENDNALETEFYDEIDYWAETMRAAFLLVHHASKGAQADKRVSDVGAGAGAQSRACDSHLVLRQHEEDGCAVLAGVVRSFKPIEPLGIRWQYPLWVPDHSIDVGALKGRVSPAERRQADRDTEADDDVLTMCQAWRSRRELRTSTGMNEDRLNRAIARLMKAGLLEYREETRRGNQCEVFRKTIHAR